MESFTELGKALDSMRERLTALEEWKAATEKYPSMPDVLTAKDIAGFMQVSIPQAYVYIRQMRHFGVDRSARATRAAFLEWLMANEVDPGGKASGKENAV